MAKTMGPCQCLRTPWQRGTRPPHAHTTIHTQHRALPRSQQTCALYEGVYFGVKLGDMAESRSRLQAHPIRRGGEWRSSGEQRG